jgi:hypothetical protein
MQLTAWTQPACIMRRQPVKPLSARLSENPSTTTLQAPHGAMFGAMQFCWSKMIPPCTPRCSAR